MDDPKAIINAYLDDELAEIQHHELAAWLRQAPGNRMRFITECCFHSQLQDIFAGEQATRYLTAFQASNGEHDSIFPKDAREASSDVDSPRFVIALSDTVLSPVDYLSNWSVFSDWSVAYLIATVIFGIGAFIGSITYVSQPVQVATNSAPPVPSVVKPEIEFVGRITGMVDCRWEKRAEGGGRRAEEAVRSSDEKSPNLQTSKSLVSLGEQFILTSGLLEITYNTGAKVILQGPVMYEVESKYGGFLSLGKLTARVDSAKPQAANPPSALRLPPSALFSVRTPTATVTDLGTEFGVEVSEKGDTTSHVFIGQVKVVRVGEDGTGTREHVLHAGQTVMLDAAKTEMIPSDGSNKRFVRALPAPLASSQASLPELIDQIDYSDTWTANTRNRPGSYLLLPGAALRVEQCPGNPSREWVFSGTSAVTTRPIDDSLILWPGFQVQGSRSGFMECGGSCYFGLKYGLRDDFIVQFDAVQTGDRVNITIGNTAATVEGPKSLSVFFRATGVPSSTPGVPLPEISLYTPSKGEVDTGLRSGIPKAHQWHNYAVRFDLPARRLTVWVDRQCRGTIDLAAIGKGGDDGRAWADLPWIKELESLTQYVTVGGYIGESKGLVWSDNFRVGSPVENIVQENPVTRRWLDKQDSER